MCYNVAAASALGYCLNFFFLSLSLVTTDFVIIILVVLVYTFFEIFTMLLRLCNVVAHENSEDTRRRENNVTKLYKVTITRIYSQIIIEFTLSVSI